MNQKISIPKPCHENWNKMQLTEKGKFCSFCKEEVVDFTKMSKEEIQLYFKKDSNTNICGKYKKSHVSFANTKSTFLSKLKYITIITIGLFLPQSCIMGKRKTEKEETEQVNISDSLQNVKNKKAELDSIKRSVEEENDSKKK